MLIFSIRAFDWFLTILHSISILSLYLFQTIFHSLPKLTDVQDDELIPLAQLQLCKCNIALENEKDKINQFENKNIDYSGLYHLMFISLDIIILYT